MESFDLNIRYDKADANVKITVEYPDNQAIAAINALRRVAEDDYIMGLMSALKDDPSVQSRLHAAGLDIADDEDWDDD
jgi:hypothetical protein